MAKDKKKENKKTKVLNLHQKLIELRKDVPYVQKSATGFNYKYVQGSVLLGLLRPTMDKLGILLSFDIEEIHTTEVERMIKKVMVKTARTTLKYIFTFTDAENPSDSISKTIWTQGIGDDIQSMGGYNTYATRYFLLGFLNIPSDKEDPDAFENAKDAATPCEVHPEYDYSKKVVFIEKYGMHKKRTEYHDYIDSLVDETGREFDFILDKAVQSEDEFIKNFNKWKQEVAEAN